MVAARVLKANATANVENIGFLCIDVAKDFLEARIADGYTTGRNFANVPNNPKGWRRLVREVGSAGINRLYVTMEATGSYWKKVAQYFYELDGTTVFVVNPSCIKGQRSTELKRSKTDRIDTGLILNFTRANLHQLKAWSPPSASIIELQSLVRFRDSRVQESVRLQNFIKSGTACPKVLTYATRDLERVKEEIKELETCIKTVITQDEALRKQAENAQSVSGIALIAAAILIAECRGFVEIRAPRQATAFSGLDVKQETSGTLRKPPQISRKGSALLRKTFVNCAATAKRAKAGKVFKEFYERLVRRGMPKKAALVATGRKLLEVTVAVILNESTFDPSRGVAQAP